MRSFKSIYCYILILCILLSCVIVAEAAENISVAEAILGTSAKTTMISRIKMGDKDDIYTVERDGRKGWMLKSNAGVNSAYINVDLSSDFASGNNDGSYYEVEVDYYDQNTAAFEIVYDSETYEQKEGEVVYTGKTQTWKTHTFKLTDALFSNRVNGYDFKICIRSTKLVSGLGDVIVGAIRVKKFKGEYPVQIKNLISEQIGNIFCNDDEQSFSFDLKNYSTDVHSGRLIYSIIGDGGNILWTLTEDFNIKRNETINKKIAFNLEKYGTYYMAVSAEYNDKVFEVKKPMSFVDSSKNDVKNKDFGINTYFNWAGWEHDKGSIVTAKTNAGFIRQGVAWTTMDQPANLAVKAFAMPQKVIDGYKEVQKQGLEIQMVYGYGNPKYMANDKCMPFDETTRQYFAEYCGFTTSELKKAGLDINTYEIWNEPNLYTSYNKNQVSGEGFGLMAIEAAKAIKSADPQAKVGTLSIANPITDASYEYAKEIFETGLTDYIDAITLHPYSQTNLPENALPPRMDKYIELYREALGDKGDVWMTEMGYVDNEFGVDHRLQAAYNVRTYLFAIATGRTSLFTLHTLSNHGAMLTNREHNFAIVNSHNPQLTEVPYSAKKSYVALTAMNTLMADTEYVQTIKDDKDEYAYRYKRGYDGKDIIAMWTKTANEGDGQMCLNLGCDSIDLYDMYGNMKTVYGVDGKYRFTIDECPVYAVGNFTEPEYVGGIDAQVGIELNTTDFEVCAGDNLSIEVNNHTGKNVTARINPITGMKNTDDVAIDKNAVLQPAVPNVSGETFDFTVDFETDGKVIQQSKITVTVNELLSSTLKAVPVEGDDINKWRLTAQISNYSFTRPIQGKLRITSFETVIHDPMTVEVPTIPVRATGEISFVLPDVMRKGMHNVEYEIELDDGSVHKFQQLLDLSMAVFADTPPVIDGYEGENEWVKNSELVSDKNEQVHMYAGFNHNGPEDLSASTRIMYDEDNFYMFVVATDDIYHKSYSGTDVFMNDSVQFAARLEKSATDLIVGGYFSEFAIGDTPEGPTVWRHVAEDNELPVGRVTNCQAAVRREGNKTYFEICIPWKEITKRPVDAHNLKTIYFSMLVNDNDDTGRKGWIEYGGGIGGAKNIEEFTMLNLLK